MECGKIDFWDSNLDEDTGSFWRKHLWKGAGLQNIWVGDGRQNCKIIKVGKTGGLGAEFFHAVMGAGYKGWERGRGGTGGVVVHCVMFKDASSAMEWNGLVHSEKEGFSVYHGGGWCWGTLAGLGVFRGKSWQHFF